MLSPFISFECRAAAMLDDSDCVHHSLSSGSINGQRIAAGLASQLQSAQLAELHRGASELHSATTTLRAAT